MDFKSPLLDVETATVKFDLETVLLITPTVIYSTRASIQFLMFDPCLYLSRALIRDSASNTDFTVFF